MEANYGYKDGSGDFFITIDTDKCTGCGACVEACPANVLEVAENEFDPMADDEMVRVTDAERKKIKYSCQPCMPTGGEEKKLPCHEACPTDAIKHSW